jgi:hypothetical protein
MQLLPFLELVAQSQRTGGVDAGKWGLPLSGWVNLVLPIAHAFRSSQGVCFRAGQEFFSSIYAGVGVVALAGWALWRARGRTVTALAILALLGLIMAWGERTPLFRIMRWCIPACGMARYPVKFMILSGFSFSLIAAYGLAHIWGRRSSSRGRATLGMGLGTAVMLAGIGALVAWAWSTRTPSDLWPATAINAGVRCAFLVATVALAAILSERHEPRFEAVVGLALLLFTWADFRTHLPVQNPTIPARNLSAAPPRSDALPKLGDGRVFITPEAEARLLQSGIEDAQADFVGKRLALWSHLNLLERVPKVNGSATLQLREEAQVQSWLYAPDSTNRVAWLDFLGATWASSSTNPVDWVRRPTALPLVTAGQSPEYRAEDKPPAAIGLEAFDGRRTVSVPEGARAEAGKAGATRALVTKTRWSANRIEFEVQADAPAWAVVAQSYAPGWRAWVNGQPARLWRVNHAFQGLPVPAGASRVRLVYRERGFLPGLGISAGALLICGLLWFRERGVSATAPSASPATPAPAAEETPIPGAEERPQEPPGS